MNVVAWQASVDARVLAALYDDPEDQLSWDELRVRAGLVDADFGAAMRRLALRETEAPTGSAAA